MRGKRRGLAIAALAAAATVLVVVVAVVADGGAHVVRAPFRSAAGVFPGLEVRMAGRKVGEVDRVRYADGQALIDLRISDKAWPLRRGATAAIRFGTTTSVAARFVEIKSGPRGAPPLPGGGLLARADTLTPVEFDEFFDVLDRDTRGHVRGLLVGGAAALRGRERALARGLDDAPGGLDATADLMHELGADPGALTTLVRSGRRTAAALRSRDAQLRGLLDVAAATFDELASRAGPTRESLERLPAALASARRVLARADTSLTAVDGLARDIGPGARRLRSTAPRVSAALAALNEVGPLATRTLRRASVEAPRIGALLARATPFAGRLRGVAAQAAVTVACIRPWGPELAGLVSTWTDFTKNYDAHGHYMRVAIAGMPFPNTVPGSPKDVVGTFPGVHSFFPRPPGLSADAPWLQPQCGAGTLDPAEDPEAGG